MFSLLGGLQFFFPPVDVMPQEKRMCKEYDSEVCFCIQQVLGLEFYKLQWGWRGKVMKECLTLASEYQLKATPFLIFLFLNTEF